MALKSGPPWAVKLQHGTTLLYQLVAQLPQHGGCVRAYAVTARAKNLWRLTEGSGQFVGQDWIFADSSAGGRLR